MSNLWRYIDDDKLTVILLVNYDDVVSKAENNK